MIITSRGCPHGCAYCSTHLVMGASFRMRSPEGILQEMMECHRQYGTEIYDIEDDNFTYHEERAKKLMRLIIETFGEGNLDLSAMNGISFASLDEELLRLMKKAGFKTINLSFVSTDPFTTKGMGRPKGATYFDKILEGGATSWPSSDRLRNLWNARSNDRRNGRYADLSHGKESSDRSECLLSDFWNSPLQEMYGKKYSSNEHFSMEVKRLSY